MKRNSVANANFSLFVLISFFTIGSELMESLLNYPSWYLIGPTDAWLPYRDLLGERIIPLLAAPALVFQTLTNIILIIYRPEPVPRWSAWVTLVLLLILVISSVTIQIPMQMAFNEAYDTEMLDRLISTDMYLRIVPGVIRAALVFYMLQKVIGSVRATLPKPAFRS